MRDGNHVHRVRALRAKNVARKACLESLGKVLVNALVLLLYAAKQCTAKQMKCDNQSFNQSKQSCRVSSMDSPIGD